MIDITPKVVGVVLFYNHEDFVDECLDSVFGQTYENFDIWILDDASKDGTQDKVREYLETHQINKNYYLDFNKENLGLVSQINKLFDANIELGDYVVLFAGDDISDVKRVEATVNRFEELPSVVALSFGITKQKKYTSQTKKTTILNKWHFVFNPLIHAPAPSRAFRSSFFRKSIKINAACVTEDTPIFFRCILIGDYLYDPSVMVYYRIHERNLHKTGKFDRNIIFQDKLKAMNSITNNLLMKFIYRLALLQELRKRKGKDLYTFNKVFLLIIRSLRLFRNIISQK